jgi:hypothetical protein
MTEAARTLDLTEVLKVLDVYRELATALSFYSELIGFMELTPWDAPAYRQDKPNGNMPKMLFGHGAEGIAVYLILEEQRRVVIVSTATISSRAWGRCAAAYAPR